MVTFIIAGERVLMEKVGVVDEALETNEGN
jgi:hypothetical protein